MKRKWNVWSRLKASDTWLVVDEGLTEADAREGVARRNRTMAKHGVTNVEYCALADGEIPVGPGISEAPALDLTPMGTAPNDWSHSTRAWTEGETQGVERMTGIRRDR